MSEEMAVRTAVCTSYETLLEKCQAACQIWNEQRAEIRESGRSGKKVDDELRRLQANYAKAYSVLRNHVHSCETCQWVCRLEGRTSVQVQSRHTLLHAAS
jgi:hypothetical protein